MTPMQVMAPGLKQHALITRRTDVASDIGGSDGDRRYATGEVQLTETADRPQGGMP